MDEKTFIYLCALIYCAYSAYNIYKMTSQKKLIAVGIYVASGIVISLGCILVDIGDYFLIISLLYGSVVPLLYYIVISIVDSKKERSLYHGIESQIRYRDDVIRTEYEDVENVFCRCIVTEPEEQVKKGRLILIVPSLPPYYGNKYYWFVDYNGNCYNNLGNYQEFSSLYNYAPYNEIADALAEAGNVVVRMDMFGRNPEAVKKTDHVKAVTAWMCYIQKLKGIDEDPIVIGHRENGLFAVQLMQSNRWKKGILICSGPNYVYMNYSKNAKNAYVLLQELSSDYSLIQIDAGLCSYRVDTGENGTKLQCSYMIRQIKNMDFTLRYCDISKKIDDTQYDNKVVRKKRGMGDGIVGKGYRIKCGTEEFPPVSNELVEMLNAEIETMGRFA